MGGTWSSLGPKPITPPAFVNAYTYGNVAGRVTALAIDPGTPTTVYLGSAGGGVWKSTNGGTSWSPMSDGYPAGIGAIAVDPNNSSIIYAATGEDNACSDICPPSHGVLKSTNGGASWTLLGQATFDLSASGSFIFFASIAVDRSNSARIVGATNFGIYVSTDSGVSWSHPTLLANAATAILGKTASGGVTQVVQDLDTASTWWAAASDWCGTEVGNMMFSTDSGANWSATTNPLPGPSGGAERVSLGIGHGVVYASVSRCTAPISEEAGPYKYATASGTWSTLTTSGINVMNPGGSGGQGFYDNVIAVDPTNANHILLGGVTVIASADGGATWTDVGKVYSYVGPNGPLHPDFHALAFAPGGGTAYAGNDGGVWSTANLGGSGATTDWTNLNATLQLTQYYAGFSKDLTTLAGGAQDNGTSGIYGGGPAAPAFGQLNGGDGGWAQFKTGTSYYTEAQSGFMGIVDTSQLSTSFGNLTANAPCDFQTIPTGPSCGDGARTPFIAPFVASPPLTSTIYAATYRVFRSTTGGLPAGSGWGSAAISPDLTTGGSDVIEKMAIRSIGGHDVVVTASHFGKIQVSFTAEAGSPATWLDITGNLPARNSGNRIPNNAWIPQIAINPSNANEIWIALGSLTIGRLYHTTNANLGAGTTWTDISGSGGSALPVAITKSVTVDPNNPSTVIAGTDAGVFICTSCGGSAAPSWSALGTGLPMSRVQFLTVTDNGLNIVAWTHGRGVWTIPMPSSAHLAVTTSTTAPTAGVAFNVTVTAQNPNNSTNTGYTGTVHFSTSAGQYNLPTDYTFVGSDAGTHTFVGGATLKSAGTQTISAADTVTAGLGGTSANLTVAAAAPAALLLTGLPSSIGQGVPFTGNVTATDAYGNSVVDTVHLDSAPVPSFAPNSAISGSGALTAAFASPGTFSVSAFDGTNRSAAFSITVLYSYYFTWYDIISEAGFLGDNIHVMNPSNTLTAHLTVSIPSPSWYPPPCPVVTVTLAPNQEATPISCSHGFGSPVLITSDIPIDASQRVQYNQSFNEVAAMPYSGSSTSLWFTKYDQAGDPLILQDNIHVINPGWTTANVTLTGIYGCPNLTAAIPAGGNQIFGCPFGFGDAVHLTSDQPILASQRVKYGKSFNEIPGQPDAGPNQKTLYFTWYDRISDVGFRVDDVIVVNTSNANGTVNVTIATPAWLTPADPNCIQTNVFIASHAALHFNCATGFGGPVLITSTQPIIASQRVDYYSSFNEVLGLPTPTATTRLFTFYDKISSVLFKGDNLHVLNPDPINSAHVTITIPTPSWLTPADPQCIQTLDIPPLAAGVIPVGLGTQIFTCNTGYGGPVTVSSSIPIIATQRVQYGTSFNEVAAF
ncbi:MAG: hypothetical protein NVS9B1_15900 [Candidatus Dormibacteraceae bacterium]